MRASSKTLLFALAIAGCSIYDETSGDISGATSGRSGTGGTGDSGRSTGGSSGTGGSTSKDASSGDTDARGTAGAGGTFGTAGTSMADSGAGSGGVSGAAGAFGVDAAAGGSGTAGAGGAAGGSGTAGAGGSTGVDGSTGADRSSGIDGADTGQPCVMGPGPANLPFAVDQYFVASGWMQAALIRQEASCIYPPPADGGATVDGGRDASVGSDSATIPDAPHDRDGSWMGDAGTRPPLPGSKCWTITYAPVSASDWAGVDWQYPIDNWGPSPGLVIPPGATRLSVVAWGALGNERVSFHVGYGPASPDGFGVSLIDQVLTQSPTQYVVDLSGIAYTCSSVRMGFGWVAAGGTGMTFHIADIRWE